MKLCSDCSLKYQKYATYFEDVEPYERLIIERDQLLSLCGKWEDRHRIDKEEIKRLQGEISRHERASAEMIERSIEAKMMLPRLRALVLRLEKENQLLSEQMRLMGGS